MYLEWMIAFLIFIVIWVTEFIYTAFEDSGSLDALSYVT